MCESCSSFRFRLLRLCIIGIILLVKYIARYIINFNLVNGAESRQSRFTVTVGLFNCLCVVIYWRWAQCIRTTENKCTGHTTQLGQLSNNKQHQYEQNNCCHRVTCGSTRWTFRNRRCGGVPWWSGVLWPVTAAWEPFRYWRQVGVLADLEQDRLTLINVVAEMTVEQPVTCDTTRCYNLDCDIEKGQGQDFRELDLLVSLALGNTIKSLL